jgi:hypothetical protein
MSISGGKAVFGLSATGTGTRPLVSSSTLIGESTATIALASDIAFSASAYLQESTDAATLNTNTMGVGITANAAVAATGVLTLTGNAVAAQTVTIGGVTYTWRASVSTTANEVLIGATASDSLDNLIDAINLEDGAGESGTLYGSDTVAHPTVSAAAGAGDTMDVTALTAGEAGNAIATTETMTNGSFGAATLTLGANANAWTGAATDFEGEAFPAATTSVQAIWIYVLTGSLTVTASGVSIPIPTLGRAQLAAATSISALLATITFTAASNDTEFQVVCLATD